jgi:hypothetical protein
VGKRPPKTGGKSQEHALKQMRHLIVGILEQQGRDFGRCEQCGDVIPAGKFELHHTRYDGATLADLRIVCKACNLSRQNMFLR